MRDDTWRETLMQRHAALFSYVPGEPAQTAQGYPAVGDGWRQVVEKAIERIAAALPRGTNFRITQIKEKLATLRIHFDVDRLPNDALMRVCEAILLAEMRSSCTCEVCGAEGRIYDDDTWLSTRCEIHAAGTPVPVRPGYEYLVLKLTLKDGAFEIDTCQRYDRARDCLVDVPPPPDWRDTSSES